MLGFPAYVKVLINDKTKQIAVTPTTAKADNAIKFSNNNSFINISTYEKGGKIFISVKDFGIGIPKDSQGKVFERFYRVDKARSRETGGTGLGLSIVKNIILMHHGTIKLYSEEGMGTTFTFRIPLNYVEEDEN